MRYEFTAEMWRSPGPGGWCFVTLPKADSEAIRAFAPGRRPAFGSIPVEASVGPATWRTSLFPDLRRGALLLPINAEARRRAAIAVGDVVTVAVVVAL